jgi:hypothetical protein
MRIKLIVFAVLALSLVFPVNAAINSTESLWFQMEDSPRNKTGTFNLTEYNGISYNSTRAALGDYSLWLDGTEDYLGGNVFCTGASSGSFWVL